VERGGRAVAHGAGAGMNGSRARKDGVEAFRFLAAVAVLLIHFWPRLDGSPHPLLDALVVGSSRFAVPFFFAASGYFLAAKLDSLSDGLRFAWRWIRILLCWHVLHALWFTALHVARAPDPWHTLPPFVPYVLSWNGLLEGVGWHLWYLHSLVLCVVLSAAIPKSVRVPVLLWLGSLLFLLALAWGPWRDLLGGFAPARPLRINPRGFLYTALLPFAWGLARPRFDSIGMPVALVLSGAALQTFEILASRGTAGSPQEYFLGSVLVGVGCLGIGLNRSFGTAMARWGRASLPMYLAQFMVFSPIAKGAETALSPWISDPWFREVVGVAVSIPAYAWICAKLADHPVWKRIHS